MARANEAWDEATTEYGSSTYYLTQGSHLICVPAADFNDGRAGPGAVFSGSVAIAPSLDS